MILIVFAITKTFYSEAPFSHWEESTLLKLKLDALFVHMKHRFLSHAELAFLSIFSAGEEPTATCRCPMEKKRRMKFWVLPFIATVPAPVGHAGVSLRLVGSGLLSLAGGCLFRHGALRSALGAGRMWPGTCQQAWVAAPTLSCVPVWPCPGCGLHAVRWGGIFLRW